MMGLWECMWTLDVYLQMMMRGKCISVFDVDQCVHNSARVLRLTSFLSLLKPTQSPRVSFTNSRSRSWVSWWATVCRSISFPSMMKPWPRSTLPWTWVTKCEGVFQKRVLLCVVYLCVCVCVWWTVCCEAADKFYIDLFVFRVIFLSLLLGVQRRWTLGTRWWKRDSTRGVLCRVSDVTNTQNILITSHSNIIIMISVFVSFSRSLVSSSEMFIITVCVSVFV